MSAMVELEFQAEDINIRVSNEVRSWLGRRRITQKVLAKELGMNATSLSYRMKGRTPWSVAELVSVAALLDITLAQLLGDEIINEKDPHREGGGLTTYTPRDSNPEPTD